MKKISIIALILVSFLSAAERPNGPYTFTYGAPYSGDYGIQYTYYSPRYYTMSECITYQNLKLQLPGTILVRACHKIKNYETDSSVD